MKKIVLILLCFLTIFSITACSSSNSSLVGKWINYEQNGKAQTIVQFYKGGNFIAKYYESVEGDKIDYNSPDDAVSGNYVIEGNKLILNYIEDSINETETSYYEIEDNLLILTDVKDEVTTFVRKK